MKKEPWQIAAARFCVENSEKGFTTDALKEFVHSKYEVHDAYVMQFIEEELQAPSGRQYSRTGRAGGWIPPLDLVSKVTDYDELKEARLNAKNAFWISMAALIASGLGAFFQYLSI
jgi:hypothetical protein